MNKQDKKTPKSLILSLLMRFSEFLYAILPSSITARLLIGREDEKKRGLFSALFAKIKFQKRISLPIKRYIARCFDTSTILKFIKNKVLLIPQIPIKSVGLFLFSFGLYSSIICLIESNMGIVTDFGHLSFSAITAVTGAILSLSKKSCYGAVSDSKFLSALVFKVMGVKHPEDENAHKILPGKSAEYLIFGIVGGVIGSFTTPYLVIAAIPCVLISILILFSPEIGVILTFLLLPFLKVSHLCYFSLLVFFSWLIKFIRGKRLLKFDSIIAVSSVFAIMILMGGIISVSPTEGLREAHTKICLMLGCFAAVNLIKTTRVVKLCTKALTISFSVLLIMGVIGSAIKFIPTDRIEIFDQIIGNNASSLFGFNSLFAYIAIIAIPMIVLKASIQNDADLKATVVIATILTLASMIVAKARSVTLGLVLSLIILLVLVSKRSLAYIIPLVLAIPAVTSLLPSKWTESITHVFRLDSLSAKYEAINSIDRIVYDTFSGGIGLGNGAFERIYPLYSVTSYEGVVGANSLYTSIQITLGFTSLVVFILLIAVMIRKYFSFISSSENDDLFIKNTATSAFSGVISLLAIGLVSNIWKDHHTFLLFWLTVSLLSSSIRIATEQRYTLPPSGPTLELDKQTIIELSRRKDSNNE